MTKAQLRRFRDRLYLHDEIPDAALEAERPALLPAPARARRRTSTCAPAAGARRARSPSASCAPEPLTLPGADAFADLLAGSGAARRSRRRWRSPGCCATCSATPPIGRHVVPIVPDEARTFGLDAALRARRRSTRPRASLHAGRRRPAAPLRRGAHRARSSRRASPRPASMATLHGAGTAYATWGQPMMPIYLFYSMFGFQRVGDLIWALGDIRGRGFLLGCTAGRTTLAGRGAAARRRPVPPPRLAPTRPPRSTTRPSPTRWPSSWRTASPRMLGPEPEDRFCYLTLYNENYPMPAAPRGRRGRRHPRRGIIRGPVPLRRRRAADVSSARAARPPSLCFSGPDVARRPWRRSASWPSDCDVGADAWSVTSWTSLRDDALSAERWNRLHPDAEARRRPSSPRRSARARTPSSPSPTTCAACPTRWRGSSTAPFTSLGTDGFGRSDARAALRRYFEVDAAHLVVAVLQQLALGGRVPPATVAGAIADLGIDPARARPVHGLSRATKVAIASSALSGTRSVKTRPSDPISMLTSKKPQHCFSRLTERRRGQERGLRVAEHACAPTWRRTRPRRPTTRRRPSTRRCAPSVTRHRGCRRLGRDRPGTSPTSPGDERIPGDLHLAQMLEELLEDVQQDGALGLGVGHRVVGVAPARSRAWPGRRARRCPRGGAGGLAGCAAAAAPPLPGR